MTDVIKCAVYYDSANLPVLCHDTLGSCVDCIHECFDAVVKIIPLEAAIEQEVLKNLQKTDKSIDRFSKEMKKTVNSLSKLRDKFK